MEETNGRIPETTPPEEPGGFGAQGDAADDWSDLEQPQEGNRRTRSPRRKRRERQALRRPRTKRRPPQTCPGRSKRNPRRSNLSLT